MHDVTQGRRMPGPRSAACFAFPLLAVVLVGCSRPDEYENAPVRAAIAASAELSPSPDGRPARISFEPSSLPDCSPAVPTIATIHWDATASGATLVDVRVADANGGETQFAAGGRVGEKQTGPWMQPGVIVVVRDHATGRQLGRAVAPSGACHG